jgi:hypothetical protein
LFPPPLRLSQTLLPNPLRHLKMGKNLFSVTIFFVVFRETIEAAIIISSVYRLSLEGTHTHHLLILPVVFYCLL